MFPVYVPAKLFRSEEAVIASFVRAMGIEELKESAEMEEVEAKVRESKRFVVLVMEDIDEYLEYGRQNFIYKVLNLFQTSRLPFVFLATTSVPDVVDMFEKRVKSRFSSHQLLMSEAPDFDLGILLWRKSILELPDSEADDWSWRMKASEMLRDGEVAKKMRAIWMAHGSFYRLYQILKETTCYFMTMVQDLEVADDELLPYVDQFLLNTLIY